MTYRLCSLLAGTLSFLTNSGATTSITVISCIPCSLIERRKGVLNWTVDLQIPPSKHHMPFADAPMLPFTRNPTRSSSLLQLHIVHKHCIPKRHITIRRRLSLMEFPRNFNFWLLLSVIGSVFCSRKENLWIREESYEAWLTLEESQKFVSFSFGQLQPQQRSIGGLL